MRGLLHRAATTALLTLLPSAAWAQTTPTGTIPTGQTTTPGASAIDQNLTVVRVDKDDVENGQIVYANLEDCSDTRKFEFRVKYSQAVPVVEAWLGVDGLNCADVANRTLQGNTTTSETKCAKLETATNQLQLKMQIDGPRIFDRDGTPNADGKYECDKVVKSPLYTVYILALSSASTRTTASAPLASAGVAAVLKASFTPYLIAPDAPEDVKPLPGEQKVGISFDPPTNDSSALTTFRAYFDLGTGSSIGCGSGLLEGGTKPDSNSAGLRSTKRGTSKTVYLGDLDDVTIGSSVAASAVTIDAAGNESAPTAPVCVQRIETTGFQDACSQDPECTGSLDSCSLSPVTRTGSFSFCLLALAALALVQRRRSR